MDPRKIKKLIEIVKESGISELEVKEGDESIRIARHVAPAAMSFAPPAASPEAAEPSRSDRPEETGNIITAPMAGTFYRAPAPGADPFVVEGQDVSGGDVLCIIESMKMMNQIESLNTGKLAAILVADGQPIESGTPLFRIV